jgi:hypothetical protein
MDDRVIFTDFLSFPLRDFRCLTNSIDKLASSIIRQEMEKVFSEASKLKVTQEKLALAENRIRMLEAHISAMPGGSEYLLVQGDFEERKVLL